MADTANNNTLKRGFTNFLGWLAVWLVTLPLLLLLILFAISNRQDVTLQLWPAPVELTLPLSLLLLGLLFSALLLGIFIGWLSQHGARALARRQTRELARLRGLIAAAPSVTTSHGKTTTIVTSPVTAHTLADDTHFKDSL